MDRKEGREGKGREGVGVDRWRQGTCYYLQQIDWLDWSACGESDSHSDSGWHGLWLCLCLSLVQLVCDREERMNDYTTGPYENDWDQCIKIGKIIFNALRPQHIALQVKIGVNRVNMTGNDEHTWWKGWLWIDERLWITKAKLLIGKPDWMSSIVHWFTKDWNCTGAKWMKINRNWTERDPRRNHVWTHLSDFFFGHSRVM